MTPTLDEALGNAISAYSAYSIAAVGLAIAVAANPQVPMAVSNATVIFNAASTTLAGTKQPIIDAYAALGM